MIESNVISEDTGKALSDPDRAVQKDLKIKEVTDRQHDPLIPSFLVDT